MMIIGLQDYSQRKLADVVKLWENSAESEAILVAHKLYLAKFNLASETPNVSLPCATPTAAPFAATPAFPPVWGSGANARVASMRSEDTTIRAVASRSARGVPPSDSPRKALVRLNVKMIADIAEATALESPELLAEELQVLQIAEKRVRALVQQAQTASGHGISDGEAEVMSTANNGAGTRSLPPSGSSSGGSTPSSSNPREIEVSMLGPDLKVSIDEQL